MKTLAQTIVPIAVDEIGVEEIDGTNCGPRVNEFKAATNLPPLEAWPWCAAFVCWCVRGAAMAAGRDFTKTFRRPTTASAWGLEAWSLAQDDSTQTLKNPGRDLLPGDIIVFKYHHCGIVETAPDETGHFTTIEGNTDHAGSREGGSVWRKWRRSDEVKTRIRFRV